MRAHAGKRGTVSEWIVYGSTVLLIITTLLFLFSCGAGVNIGEANKVLTAFSIEWPAGFENSCITGVPVPVTIKALDQNGKLFTSWNGNISIENENISVSVNPLTVFLSNGSKEVDMIFTVSEEDTTRIRVWYGDVSCPWCTDITVQKIFSIATIDPSDGFFLAGHQEIDITFNEATQTSSLLLGGDLAGADTAWSTTNNTDDTLTLTPPTDTFWPEGPGKTLTIQCDSLAGGQTDDASLSYDVVHGMFVSAQNSNDTYPGTADQPKRTIRGAINGVVDEGYATAGIRVAEGDYSFSWEDDGPSNIDMVEGVSLYGGYWIDDWHVRNPSSYATTIEDTSTSGGTSSDPTRAIYCPAGITTATVIEGFTIKGGTGSYSAAVLCKVSGSPTIENNTIYGGNAGTDSYGIHGYGVVTFASPHILNNTIDGGSGAASSCGIYISTSNAIIEGNDIDGGTSSGASYGIKASAGDKGVPTIKKNRIYGGIGGTKSYGIYNFYNDSKIWNNIIHGGGGDCTYGIYTETAFPEIRNNTINGGLPKDGDFPTHIPYCIYSDLSQPAVDNNILFASIAMYAYGYYELYEDDELSPTSFNNNSIFDCDNALYYETSLHDFDSIGDVNGLSFANGNISEDISASLDSAFRFTGTLSTVIFDTSGLDGSTQEPAWGFSGDMDDVTRTGNGSIGWSIGAYEYDE